MCRPWKGPRKLQLHRKLKVNRGIGAHAEPAVSAPATGHDEHDGPVRAAKTTMECFFVLAAWQWRATWMGVDPDAGEFLRMPALIDLRIHIIGDRTVIKGKSHRC